jgi:hypothetical protein
MADIVTATDTSATGDMADTEVHTMYVSCPVSRVSCAVES